MITKKTPKKMKKSFVRITALHWADILVAFALFVMQDYLTDVWKLSFTHAAGIVNIWGGISKVLPVFSLFLADAFLGNFMMLVISNIAYSVGIGLLTMSTPPVLAESTGTCRQYEPECIGHTQKVLFYTGMALIAVGVAGNLVSLKPFLDDEQKDDDGRAASCLKVIGMILVVVVPLTGAIALPYIKPWSLRFGIPAICTVVGTLFFLSGSCCYDKKEPEGSPITNICRVFVAATCKICKPRPVDAGKLHRANEREKFKHTRFLRCLEKAAIKPDNEDQQVNRWRLCSVAEVEEAKIAVRMVPMWMTFIICGIVSSIGSTYFVEQAKNMNRKVGKAKVPPQLLLLVQKGAKNSFAILADRILKKESIEDASSTQKTSETDTSSTRKTSETDAPAREVSEKGVPATQKISKRPAIGIGIGMTFSVLCCITAAKIEQRRRGVIRRHGLLDKPDEVIPMNILWLVFQFVLLGGLDAFLENSVAEFYKHQSPPSMTKYLECFTRGVSGLGYMCSVLSVFVVGKISEGGGKPNWFQYTLNKSRLDRYFWVLAALSSVDLIVFILVASFYRYKNQEVPSEEVDAKGEGDGELYGGNNNFNCCCCG